MKFLKFRIGAFTDYYRGGIDIGRCLHFGGHQGGLAGIWALWRAIEIPVHFADAGKPGGCVQLDPPVRGYAVDFLKVWKKLKLLHFWLNPGFSFAARQALSVFVDIELKRIGTTSVFA